MCLNPPQEWREMEVKWYSILKEPILKTRLSADKGRDEEYQNQILDILIYTSFPSLQLVVLLLCWISHFPLEKISYTARSCASPLILQTNNVFHITLSVNLSLMQSQVTTKHLNVCMGIMSWLLLGVLVISYTRLFLLLVVLVLSWFKFEKGNLIISTYQNIWVVYKFFMSCKSFYFFFCFSLVLLRRVLVFYVAVLVWIPKLVLLWRQRSWLTLA